MTHRKYNRNQSMTNCSHTEVFPGTRQCLYYCCILYSCFFSWSLYCKHVHGY